VSWDFLLKVFSWIGLINSPAPFEYLRKFAAKMFTTQGWPVKNCSCVFGVAVVNYCRQQHHKWSHLFQRFTLIAFVCVGGTCGKVPPVSLTQEANLQVVSTTEWINFLPRSQWLLGSIMTNNTRMHYVRTWLWTLGEKNLSFSADRGSVESKQNMKRLSVKK
jgi:hypothetical protein